MPRSLILSQGDEVVSGQVVDTNAPWIAARLTALGLPVLRHVTVRDDTAEIRTAIAAAVAEADVVVCTGGLGPTEDDRTAEAVAEALSLPLALDPVALEHIRGVYARIGRPMPPANEKQAWLPSGARRLDNDLGTAPGFAVEAGAGLVICLPGVPREMRALWERHVDPLLRERHGLVPGPVVTLHAAGIGESEIQERIGPWREAGVSLSTRILPFENRIALGFAPGTPADRIRAVTAEVAGRIGSAVFAIGGLDAPPVAGVAPGGRLPEAVGHHLEARGETLATAESCSGGRLAAACTAIPGASAWFVEGIVAYANAAKVRRLGVPESLIATHGAVSEPVARAMAEGVRTATGATWALSTTGIAGPDGGTADKPVGTVHVALAAAGVTHHRRLRLGGDRHRIQTLTVAAALDLLRRALTDHL